MVNVYLPEDRSHEMRYARNGVRAPENGYALVLNFTPAAGCNYLGNAVGGTIHRELSGLSKAPPASGHLVRPSLARGTTTAT